MRAASRVTNVSVFNHDSGEKCHWNANTTASNPHAGLMLGMSISRAVHPIRLCTCRRNSHPPRLPWGLRHRDLQPCRQRTGLFSIRLHTMVHNRASSANLTRCELEEQLWLSSESREDQYRRKDESGRLLDEDTGSRRTMFFDLGWSPWAFVCPSLTLTLKSLLPLQDHCERGDSKALYIP